MTETEKAIRDFCGHHADWWPSTTQVQEMLALAQPQQEPVAWHYPGGKPDQCTTDKAYAEKDPAWTPMYYKQEWVGLTDEEAYKIYRDCGDLNVRINIARAIEAKLKEKNT